MRSFITAAAGAVMALGMIATASAQDGAAQIEAVMGEYLKVWNNHDAGTITRLFYRLEGEHPWSAEAGLKAEFDRLKAAGYSHSDTHSIRGCLTAPDTGQVELKFTRRTNDGGFMPPEMRTSLYHLKRFEEGWRITGLGPMREGQSLECQAT